MPILSYSPFKFSSFCTGRVGSGFWAAPTQQPDAYGPNPLGIFESAVGTPTICDQFPKRKFDFRLFSAQTRQKSWKSRSLSGSSKYKKHAPWAIVACFLGPSRNFRNLRKKSGIEGPRKQATIAQGAYFLISSSQWGISLFSRFLPCLSRKKKLKIEKKFGNWSQRVEALAADS